jgi:predicted PhzF superfamily epimerase YddE/YHI9
VSRLHILRVFCDDDGSGGNPLAVFLDGGEVPPSARQAIAADLGLSETVFVDDASSGELRIFTPAVEMKFAGHPTVGAAWLLAREVGPVPTLRVPAGELRVRHADGASFVTARPEWSPDFEWERLDSPADVDALTGPPGGHDAIGAWAWLDEAAATIRARVFPVRYGIEEDEATGAAAVLLCARLARAIEVRQGRGSRIRARPLDGGYVELGGRSVLDEVREYDVPPAQL